MFRQCLHNCKAWQGVIKNFQHPTVNAWRSVIPRHLGSRLCEAIKMSISGLLASGKMILLGQAEIPPHYDISCGLNLGSALCTVCLVGSLSAEHFPSCTRPNQLACAAVSSSSKPASSAFSSQTSGTVHKLPPFPIRVNGRDKTAYNAL